MTKQAHTPGPWTVRQDKDFDTGHFDILDADECRVASITNDYVDYENARAHWLSDDCSMEADAHLIAASPALLEALKKLMSRSAVLATLDDDEREEALAAVALAEPQS